MTAYWQLLLFCVLAQKHSEARAQSCEGQRRIGQVGDYAKDPETGLQLFVNFTFKNSGQVRGWKIFAKRTDVPVYVSVYRDWLAWTDRIGTTKIHPDKLGEYTHLLDESEYISVAEGDFIGVHYDNAGLLAANVDFSVIPKKDDSESKVKVLKGFGEAEWLENGEWALWTGDWEDLYETTGRPAIEALVCDAPAKPTPAPPGGGPDLSGAKCVFPFVYQNETFNSCIKYGEKYWWCSTDAEYKGWFKRCDKNDPIPENMPCHFPFEYQGATFNSCYSYRNKKPWCLVEEKETGDNWRYCTRKDKLPELAPCRLPFIYRFKTYDKCTAIKDKRPWCSTRALYSPIHWRYCHEVEVNALKQALAEPLKTEADAINTCWFQDKVLASEYDVRSAWDLGQEHCECGWLQGGKKLRFAQKGGECDVPHGVEECENPTVAFCVKEW